MKDFKALVLAHYDFTDKDNRKVNTTKLLVSLGEFGVREICTPLANSYDLLDELKVRLGYKNNKFVIDAIIK